MSVCLPGCPARRDGNGLGLKVARRIVETHGGELTITSQFGQGATALVQLPVRPRSR